MLAPRRYGLCVIRSMTVSKSPSKSLFRSRSLSASRTGSVSATRSGSRPVIRSRSASLTRTRTCHQVAASCPHLSDSPYGSAKGTLVFPKLRSHSFIQLHRSTGCRIELGDFVLRSPACSVGACSCSVVWSPCEQGRPAALADAWLLQDRAQEPAPRLAP